MAPVVSAPTAKGEATSTPPQHWPAAAHREPASNRTSQDPGRHTPAGAGPSWPLRPQPRPLERGGQTRLATGRLGGRLGNTSHDPGKPGILGSFGLARPMPSSTRPATPHVPRMGQRQRRIRPGGGQIRQWQPPLPRSWLLIESGGRPHLATARLGAGRHRRGPAVEDQPRP